MTTKTLKSSQKEFMNDAVRGLVGNLVFLGDTTGQSSIFQGTNFGYQSGGGPPFNNVIQKFPFASDANATDVSDLTSALYNFDSQPLFINRWSTIFKGA